MSVDSLNSLAAPRAEEDPAQVLHPEARLPRRRAHREGGRRRARGDREAGLPVGGRNGGRERDIHKEKQTIIHYFVHYRD